MTNEVERNNQHLKTVESAVFLSSTLAFVLCIALLSLSGCRSDIDRSNDNLIEDHNRTTLHIAAATNLRFAFSEIEEAFEELHPDINLEITFGSSGTFFAQLTQKAPFDVFFSADTRYPKQLVAHGYAMEDGYFLYAQGQIVIWVTDNSPLELEDLGSQVLADATVRKIAIANPKHAPYGEAAVEAMKNLNIYESSKKRLVFGENVAQAMHFIESGTADIGIIALSLALAPQMKQKGQFWQIPNDTYQPLEQASVILSSCDNPDEAAKLRSFVTGEEGQKILQQFGYFPTGE